jgi:CubicO group peptidase (beta-lactamase class C family)
MTKRLHIKSLVWLTLVSASLAGCLSPAVGSSQPVEQKKGEQTTSRQVSRNEINYEAIRSSLSQVVNGGTVEGASLLLVQDGEVLFKEARGNLTLDKPVKIASSTKPVATVGVLILVDEGKIRLTDTIGSLLPEFRGTKVEHATLKQLLAHSAGIIGKYPEGRPSKGSLAEFSELISKKGTLQAPGEFNYSGVSIDIACRMAEVAAGIPIEDHLRKRVWEPLEMSHSSFDLAADPGSISSAQQSRGEGRYVSCGGGMESTLDDMANFYQMLLNGGVYKGKRILAEASYHEMTRKQAVNPRKQNDPYTSGEYGLGLYRDRVAPDGSPLTISHGGAFGTMPWADLDNGLVGVFFTENIRLRTVMPFIADIQRFARGDDGPATASATPAQTAGGRQQRERDPEQLFKHISGGSESISRSEFENFIENSGRSGGRLKGNPDMIERVFNRLDANNDGELTQEEFANMRNSRR